MASKAAAKAVGDVISITQKQTLQSSGIWEVLRKMLAIDPNRSNGIPLNPYFRNPTPGSVDPKAYDDPVTMPAGDIAGNPYWKRDSRRNYPRLSVIKQGDVVSLLSVGSEAAPKKELVGDSGAKALVEAKSEGEKGIAEFMAKNVNVAAKDVLKDGMPPLPSGESMASGTWGVYKYKLSEDNSYPERYPCRSFE